MPGTIKAITESTLKGKNAVVTSMPGMNVTSKVLKALESEGLNIGYLDMAHYAGLHLGRLTHEGNELRMKVADTFILAETVVLNNGSYISGATLEVVKALMSDRVLYGVSLPKVKSVVVIFTDDPQDSAPKLSKVSNTVKVNIR
jgi:hypothetical protein